MTYVYYCKACKLAVEKEYPIGTCPTTVPCSKCGKDIKIDITENIKTANIKIPQSFKATSPYYDSNRNALYKQAEKDGLGLRDGEE